MLIIALALPADLARAPGLASALAERLRPPTGPSLPASSRCRPTRSSAGYCGRRSSARRRPKTRRTPPIPCGTRARTPRGCRAPRRRRSSRPNSTAATRCSHSARGRSMRSLRRAPGEKEPLWKLTVPEALALHRARQRGAGAAGAREHSARRPSHRRPAHDNLPLALRHRSRQIRVRLVAHRALLNPTSALTQEMRERTSRGELYDWGRESWRGDCGGFYVREVGGARSTSTAAA